MTKNRIKVLNIIPFIVLFVLIFYFSKSSQISGDDIRYILRSSYNFILPQERIETIVQAFESSIYDYFVQDARIVSTFINNSILIFDTKLYQILNPIIITTEFYCGLRVMKGKQFDSKKDLLVNSFAILCWFLITPSLMDESVYWITGAVFYSWPMFATMMVVYFMFNNIKSNFFTRVVFMLVALRVGFATENLSISISIIALLLCIYNYIIKNKEYITGFRINIYLILWISSAAEMLSPGIHTRAEQIVYDSLFDRAIHGITFFPSAQYLNGGFIAIILIALLAIYVGNYNKKLKMVLLGTSLPLCILLLLNTFPFNNTLLNNNIITYFFICPNAICLYHGLLLEKLIVLGYYYILTLEVAITVIYLFIKNKDQKEFVIFIFCTITNLALVPLGGAAERATIYSQFFMIFAIAYLLYKDVFNVLNRFVVVVAYALVITIFIHKCTYLSSNVAVALVRDDIYKEIKENPPLSKEIVLPRYRYTTYCNFDDYYCFTEDFIKYYLELDETYYFNMVDRKEFGVNW